MILNPFVFYIIDYDIQGSHSDQLINRVENFDYNGNVNNLDYNSDGWYYRDGFECYIDRNVLTFLKEKIEGIYYRFTFSHYFGYYFTAKNYSQIRLTYNMNTIFSVKDQNDASLFLSNFAWSMGSSVWYLNFGRLPNVFDDNGTVILNDTAILNQASFIEIHLKYRYTHDYLGYVTYDIDQYLVLSSDLEILMILIPYPNFFVD